MKFLNFFYFLWANFALVDPDAADQNQCGPYPDRIRIHNTALLQVKGLHLASSGDGGNCNKNHDLLTYSKPMTWDGFFSHWMHWLVVLAGKVEQWAVHRLHHFLFAHCHFKVAEKLCRVLFIVLRNSTFFIECQMDDDASQFCKGF